jgi:hypothetical protein
VYAQPEVFSDPSFDIGFRVTTKLSGDRPNEIGVVHTPQQKDPHPPWRLAQWGSEHLLLPGEVDREVDGAWRLQTAGKQVRIVGEPDGETTIALTVLGTSEFGGRLRKREEPWPHLLIEQKLGEEGKGITPSGLRFKAAFRVTRCEVSEGVELAQLDPGLHTAQVSAYWTAHAFKDGSPTGEMFWFGIPFFDARYPIPPGHFAIDFAPGGGGKFISSLSGKLLYDQPTGDGAWHEVNLELLPNLAKGLEEAQVRGHMEGLSVTDFRLTSFNLGWELTGPYDATIEIHGLSLQRNSEDAHATE